MGLKKAQMINKTMQKVPKPKIQIQSFLNSGSLSSAGLDECFLVSS